MNCHLPDVRWAILYPVDWLKDGYTNFDSTNDQRLVIVNRPVIGSANQLHQGKQLIIGGVSMSTRPS
jgi:hypothetical protein